MIAPGPRLVVGLGNPGPRYRGTRHNVGFEVVDLLAEKLLATWDAGLPSVECSHAGHSGGPVILAKPLLYMNRSGLAVAELVALQGTEPHSVLVVLDDADLELGRIRIRPGGSCAGHNGLESISRALDTTEFPRVRLGVRGPGRPAGDLAEYVLSTFDEGEREVVDRVVRSAAEAILEILEAGIPAAMNRFNGLRLAPPPPEC